MGISQLSTEFGRTVKRRRNELGLTQAMLAKALGVSRPAVTAIERGNARVHLEQLFKLAAALECLPVDLLPDPDIAHAHSLIDLTDEERAWVDRIISVDPLQPA